MQRQITQLDDHIAVWLSSADGRSIHETDNSGGSTVKHPHREFMHYMTYVRDIIFGQGHIVTLIVTMLSP